MDLHFAGGLLAEDGVEKQELVKGQVAGVVRREHATNPLPKRILLEKEKE